MPGTKRSTRKHHITENKLKTQSEDEILSQETVAIVNKPSCQANEVTEKQHLGRRNS